MPWPLVWLLAVPCSLLSLLCVHSLLEHRLVNTLTDRLRLYGLMLLPASWTGASNFLWPRLPKSPPMEARHLSVSPAGPEYRELLSVWRIRHGHQKHLLLCIHGGGRPDRRARSSSPQLSLSAAYYPITCPEGRISDSVLAGADMQAHPVNSPERHPSPPPFYSADSLRR
ncbi:hypothetical protein C8R46DRAFT_1049542 [Mycena filopes]|nr:hypothetical protein C8R46DRAFT_1049542 [Mycena filopes]